MLLQYIIYLYNNFERIIVSSFLILKWHKEIINFWNEFHPSHSVIRRDFLFYTEMHDIPHLWVLSSDFRQQIYTLC